jgi:hypothetical protein
MRDDIDTAAVGLERKPMPDVQSLNGSDKCRQICSARQPMQACSGS